MLRQASRPRLRAADHQGRAAREPASRLATRLPTRRAPASNRARHDHPPSKPRRHRTRPTRGTCRAATPPPRPIRARRPHQSAIHHAPPSSPRRARAPSAPRRPATHRSRAGAHRLLQLLGARARPRRAPPPPRNAIPAGLARRRARCGDQTTTRLRRILPSLLPTRGTPARHHAVPGAGATGVCPGLCPPSISRSGPSRQVSRQLAATGAELETAGIAQR
jgi:hypothetical protein